jgi:hypothetical protein
VDKVDDAVKGTLTVVSTCGTWTVPVKLKISNDFGMLRFDFAKPPPPLTFDGAGTITKATMSVVIEGVMFTYPIKKCVGLQMSIGGTLNLVL